MFELFNHRDSVHRITSDAARSKRTSRSKWIAGLLRLSLPLALAACGGGGSSGNTPPNTIGTLAYALTECRDTPDGFIEQQQVRIRQGDHDPITVAQPPGVGPVNGVRGLCAAVMVGRWGGAAAFREAVQTVSVSPDGETVAFEVSDAFSVFPPLPLHIPPEKQGIFVVGADGTGLRRLGPPSREPFELIINGFLYVSGRTAFSFAPDGRRLAMIDKGPDANGNEASQLLLIDAASGRRAQITHLPPAKLPPDLPANAPGIEGFFFVDNETIIFGTWADVDGSNPDGKHVVFTVKTDAPFTLKPGSSLAVLPGSQVVPIFAITGARPIIDFVQVPGVPVNHAIPGPPTVREIFLFDGDNVLQLTTFGRDDTGDGGGLVDVNGERVYFPASANPPELGNSNPSENCQIFSLDRNGGDLQQLTSFSDAPHSKAGCTFSRGPGCAPRPFAQDARTRQLIVQSNCNPLGTNPDGDQVFAMNPDGTGLRQLTDARGLVREADGTVLGELPGTLAYGPYLP